MTEPKVAVLDTTFVLPLFGNDVEFTPGFKDVLKSIWKYGIDGYKLVLPTVCLLEVGYKLNKEYRERGDKHILERCPTVLPTVTRSSVVHMHDPHLDPAASSAAMERSPDTDRGWKSADHQRRLQTRSRRSQERSYT
jgi:hypothetical protein